MIGARSVTKWYGDKLAVNDLRFTVKPGIVTGFLGPNGAGKSSRTRLIVGLDAPTAEEVTVNRGRYVDFRAPLRGGRPLARVRSVHGGQRRQASAGAAPVCTGHRVLSEDTHGTTARPACSR